MPPGAQLPSVPSSQAPAGQSTVRGRKPSPQWTQDRNFASTRFWVLDPGEYAVETWLWTRVYPTTNGIQDPASIRILQEVAWEAVVRHPQSGVRGN